MGPKLKSTVFKAPLFPKRRRRTKKLHRDLREQLEFYFSEANLRHDAFMREKAGEYGTNDIPISLFLSFPLIQQMKVSEKNVIAALENSLILEVNQEETHLRRRYPVSGPPHDLEESTLYIENLPPDCTIEWLKDVCHKTGTVRHISLPRYRKSGQIKGFAFIEYASPDDVFRACRIFKDPPNNFFPSRTEKYLKRLKRIQMSRTADSNKLTVSVCNEVTPNNSDSYLNKSFGSAIEFEQLHSSIDFHPQPRKRKRSDDDDDDDESNHSPGATSGFSNHIPLKKIKSSTADHHALSNKNSLNLPEKSPQNSEACGDGILYNATTQIANNEPNSDSKHIKFNGVVCEVEKQETPRQTSDKDLSVESHKQLEKVDKGLISIIKRKRSLSEPTATVDEEEIFTKKLKEDENLASENNSEINPVPIHIPSIAELLSQGRQAAQNVSSPFASPTKPLIPSVITKQITLPKKSTPRSKKSRDRKRLKAGRIPPNLTVMPKVSWNDLKKEYKCLQKQNMSKLKMTIQENKDAGSVFIKKHLDVLHDVRIKNDSDDPELAYDESQRPNVIRVHSLLKRGAPRFQPGVIVCISSLGDSRVVCGNDVDTRTPLPGVEEIKEILNKYSQGVAYVDVKPGDVEGFVRFNDGESAQRAILEEKSLALCLLTGEHEEKYWDKLLASRARKFSKERPKIRGRTKILAKAEALVEKGKRKHIRFDNDFQTT